MSIEGIIKKQENFASEGSTKVIIINTQLDNDKSPLLIREDFGKDSEDFWKGVRFKTVCDLCIAWHKEDFNLEDLNDMPDLFSFISLSEGDIILNERDSSYLCTVESVSNSDLSEAVSQDFLLNLTNKQKPKTSLVFQRVLVSSKMPFEESFFKRGEYWIKDRNINELKERY